MKVRFGLGLKGCEGYSDKNGDMILTVQWKICDQSWKVRANISKKI